MENQDLAVGDLRTFDQIVDFCRSIQVRFGSSLDIQAEKRRYQRALIDLCRRCADGTCPEGCEVKKAYRTTLY